MTTARTDTSSIREAVGIFIGREQLENVIQDLMDYGIEHDELGLLAGEFTVEKSMQDIYNRVNQHNNQDLSPITAFVKKESLGDTFRSLSGGLVFTGATSAMGIAVISTGIFGGAALAAITGAAAVGTVGALIAMLIHQSDAEYLEEQVDEGHLLLFVRLNHPETEQEIIDILSRHSGIDVKVIELKT